MFQSHSLSMLCFTFGVTVGFLMKSLQLTNPFSRITGILTFRLVLRGLFTFSACFGFIHSVKGVYYFLHRLESIFNACDHPCESSWRSSCRSSLPSSRPASGSCPCLPSSSSSRGSSTHYAYHQPERVLLRLPFLLDTQETNAAPLAFRGTHPHGCHRDSTDNLNTWVFLGSH